jgi:hypothetical protein
MMGYRLTANRQIIGGKREKKGRVRGKKGKKVTFN